MFENFSINKYKYLKYPKSGSIKQLQEIMSLNDMPLDVAFANKFDDIYNVFEKILLKRRIEPPTKLINDLINKSKPVIMSIKNYHDRERPDVAAKNFGINFKYHKMNSAQTPAFPSGHSAQAQLVANVLSDIYPVHSAEFLQAAQNISNSRLVAHVHYKSDSDAGIKIGNDLYEHYKKVA
tara:strand:+ start:6779 stop:7318 length:540 start_codon:yes stop_codon:yes gene_type:complete